MPEKNENYDEDLNRTSKGIAAKGVKSPMKTLGRLLKYAFLRNKAATVFVVIFVLLSSVATVTAASRVSVIVTALIDGTTSGDWDTQLIYTNIIIMACIYFVGAASSYAYNLIMMYIAQGTLRKMRDDMFATMQTLPLQYFDTHTHGDLMSLYTNDVDTMRQLLTQTIPQLISSVLTLLAVLGFMIYYSVTLLLVVLVVLVGIIIVTKIIGGRSAKYYLANQRALGALNGYVEEMTEGQKVIKVFCHEPNARAGFKEVNDALNEAGSKANAYAFLMGPVNNNLGYLQYVLVAIVGVVIMATVGQPGLLSIYCANSDVTNSMALMAGMLVSYLMYSRQFNMPVQQVSQQFSAIVMALAGAERIFEMIDTAPEDKGGDIVLTHGEVEGGGWAWKKPDGDGTFEYIPLKGDIRFNDVVFGYTPEKVILKNISLYAKPGQKIAFV